MARLTSALLVSALVRRADQQGGSAMILAKGDAGAGGILLVTYYKGSNPRLFERGSDPQGAPTLLPAGPQDIADEMAVRDYWQRRRGFDRDLWVVELDIADAERFAAETMNLC
ncbi:DUF1491 family protein [Sphingomonas gei]|uniref:DUF1491 family protein n=1 Tax=Sphingomonas gei TaxID=1395960 RepID=A0A4S1XAH5_9SPHN|nr:DUF1491 family protein [Sphingomonas gei]TGX53304.1 DUF1491 family protein [Sphingomonas gei]